MEDMLKKAIANVLTEEYVMSIPEHKEEHIFSQKYSYNKNKLIKKREQPFYVITNTVSKRAACIIAAILVASFTTVMSVDALRNAFKNFFVNIFSNHSEISIIEDNSQVSYPDIIESAFEITYDLSDYSVDYEEYDDLTRNIVYKKDKTYIYFTQYVKSEYDVRLNTENAEISTVDIDNYEAVYYLDNNNYHHIIWDNGEYVFMLSSNIGKNVLIDIAKSVEKVE